MIISSPTHGLGDTTFLTALCKNIEEPVTVRLPTHAKRFSILFDKIAKVEICGEQDLRPVPDFGTGHYTRQKLRGFFGNEAEYMDIRPLVLHTNASSEFFAGEYLRDKQNPVIFTPTCSKTWANVRNLSPALAKLVFDNLKEKGYTPIVCQSSDNYMDIGEHQLTDLDLSKLICLMRQVGTYVGCNTGSEHLMTAVGGKTIVYQPADHSLFNHSEWNYEHPNSIYYTWPVS